LDSALVVVLAVFKPTASQSTGAFHVISPSCVNPKVFSAVVVNATQPLPSQYLKAGATVDTAGVEKSIVISVNCL